ncbi:MAG TPA: hypothetical protein VGB68_08785, partial [Pyrinomonadaceae bacterium]
MEKLQVFNFSRKLVALIFVAFLCVSGVVAQERWTEQKAKDWYAAEGWLVGANFVPASAINELEMWQADT